MKKRTFILSLVITLLLILVLGYIYFNGSPKLKEESKEIAAEYLRKAYPDESFTIDSVGYYPGEGTYIVHFISKDGTKQGNIDVRNGKIVENGEELFIEE